MKKPKLIRCEVCPDVNAPCDSITGKWHTGWRISESDRIAFYHGRKWWMCRGGLPIHGPFNTKAEALN